MKAMRRQISMTIAAIGMLALSWVVLRYRFPGAPLGMWVAVLIVAAVIGGVAAVVWIIIRAAADGLRADLDALHQSRMTNRCRNCSYDLTGNVSGVCPECGTPVPQNTEATA